ncbi:MAG TPA: hypothetical protein VIK52_06335 [Opitutaceae bacterium]
MNRHFLPFALAAISFVSGLHLAAQSEPAPLPVTPVPSSPQAETVPTIEPRIALPAAAPAVADDSKVRTEKLESDIAKLRTELAKAKTDLTKTQADLNTAKANSALGSGRLKSDLDRAAAERDTLAAKIAGVTADKERAESTRDQAQVDLASARARLEVYEKSIREGAPVDAAALREALRESQSRVDMTVRAFAIIEQENNRIRSQLSGSSPQAFKSDLADTERALQQAQNDLAAEKIRSANLARELARARPDMLMVIEEPPPTASPRGLSLPTHPSAVAGPEPAEPVAEARIHVVADGENLSVISHRYYETPNRWMEIYNANRDVMKNENYLVPGMKLRIP